LHGRIVDRTGAPVDAIVDLSRVDAPDGSCADLLAEDHDTTAGRYVIDAVPAGRLHVRVWHPDFAVLVTTIIHDGTARDLVLDVGATWTGRVIDPDGHPIDRCTIEVGDGYWTDRAGRCAAGGAFVIRHLPSGLANARVRVEDSPLGARRTFGSPIVIPSRPAFSEDIKLEPGLHITGIVVDTNGKPVEGAWLDVAPRRTSNRNVVRDLQVVSDAHGTFAARHLPPGTWHLHGDLKSRHGAASLDVQAGTSNVLFVIPAKP
jgi:hypothetical protein